MKYNASMITNGYLLSKEVACQLVNNEIKRLQITIDGPQYIHNETRILENGNGSYNKIIKNIEEHNDKFKINIRINVSRKNKDYLEDLLIDFKERKLHEKVSLYVAHVEVHNEESNDYISHCLSRPIFSKLMIKFYDLAFRMGFKVSLYPKTLLGGCSASGINSFVIAGDGNIYKCWHSIGKKEEAISNIEIINKFKPDLYNWLAFSPLNQVECRNCKVLPLCMGRCPHYWVIQGKKPQCSEFKYNLGGVLKMFNKQQDVLKRLNK